MAERANYERQGRLGLRQLLWPNGSRDTNSGGVPGLRFYGVREHRGAVIRFVQFSVVVCTASVD
jgi:hypothetical protein